MDKELQIHIFGATVFIVTWSWQFFLEKRVIIIIMWREELIIDY